MGCIFSHTDPMRDSYVYETEMPDFSHVREPPVSQNRKSVMSSSYFQKYIKRDTGHDAAYTEILE
jgi:hypothetical protein